ncbi:MAG: hypothetical protein EPO21_23470 [Chloroflexota bacterium]|nr:MAG: hypothetical protein EPO21_23470 [Chloroflexota bacterium]
MSEHEHGGMYRYSADDTLDWEHLGRSVRRGGFLLRSFGLVVGASLTAQALLGLWRWLRRPPGG